MFLDSALRSYDIFKTYNLELIISSKFRVVYFSKLDFNILGKITGDLLILSTNPGVDFSMNYIVLEDNVESLLKLLDKLELFDFKKIIELSARNLEATLKSTKDSISSAKETALENLELNNSISVLNERVIKLSQDVKSKEGAIALNESILQASTLRMTTAENMVLKRESELQSVLTKVNDLQSKLKKEPLKVSKDFVSSPIIFIRYMHNYTEYKELVEALIKYYANDILFVDFSIIGKLEALLEVPITSNNQTTLDIVSTSSKTLSENELLAHTKVIKRDAFESTSNLYTGFKYKLPASFRNIHWLKQFATNKRVTLVFYEPIPEIEEYVIETGLPVFIPVTNSKFSIRDYYFIKTFNENTMLLCLANNNGGLLKFVKDNHLDSILKVLDGGRS